MWIGAEDKPALINVKLLISRCKLMEVVFPTGANRTPTKINNFDANQRQSAEIRGSRVRRRSTVIAIGTHKDIHVSVAINGLGARLTTASFPVTTQGYLQVAAWAAEHGVVHAFGIDLSAKLEQDAVNGLGKVARELSAAKPMRVDWT